MHFTELGLVTRNANETYYRVACVGFSSRANQQKPLLLEFNQNSVNIKDLAWPSHCTSGLGFLSSYSFVGACAYSMPTATIGTNGRIQDKTQMAERAYLGLLSSNGSLLTFGEDGRGSTRSAYSQVKKRDDIFLFEELTNVGDFDSLVLGGDAVGKNPMCERLLERSMADVQQRRLGRTVLRRTLHPGVRYSTEQSPHVS